LFICDFKGRHAFALLKLLNFVSRQSLVKYIQTHGSSQKHKEKAKMGQAWPLPPISLIYALYKRYKFLMADFAPVVPGHALSGLDKIWSCGLYGT
jgi:hypothetical protein